MMMACILLVTVCAGAAIPARAHEFWLQPSNYFPAIGEKVRITHHNGQFFHGDTYPYLRQWFQRFDMIDAHSAMPVKGTDGDDPAATLRFANAGTAILVYHSTPDLLTFKTWAMFKSYLADEGLSQILYQHRARGLPETGIREHYVRCAKALIAVGGQVAKDRAVGLPLELLAEKPPTSLTPGERLPVRLLHRGKAAAGALVKIFRKGDRKNPMRLRTDQDGRVLIALPEADAYLLNAVLMRPAKPGARVHWESLWASLTFSTAKR